MKKAVDMDTVDIDVVFKAAPSLQRRGRPPKWRPNPQDCQRLDEAFEALEDLKVLVE
jgi:hypothetical protein